MKVYRKSIGILLDNEEAYFALLTASIESVDELSIMVITKNPHDYKFSISPSEPILISNLIREINNLNNLFGIRVDFAKSIKNSGSIDFFLRF